MKLMIFILTFLFVTLAFAKDDADIKKFNEAMLKNIDTVIKNNPQIYEQDSPGRAPASVDVQVEIEKEMREDTGEKINTFDQQNVGSPSW